MTDFQRDPHVIAPTPVHHTGRPLDRVRWAAVVAGLFVAMSTMAVLSVLGVAIGLSAVDGNENRESAYNFGIGAGIWGAVSALISFFVGGLIASWLSASRRGHGSREVTAEHVHDRDDDRPIKGWLQGLMVWAVTIPLSAWLVGGAAAGLARGAGEMAATGVQATATAADDLGDGRSSTTQEAGNAARNAAERVRSAMTPQNVDDAADTAAATSWGLLISMLLALGAAVGGGAAGSKIRE